MKHIRPKSPSISRLPLADYRELRKKVLERDRWRCQNCGSIKNLQVHHLQFRSHLGGDLEENLITLCCECHARAHSSAGVTKTRKSLLLM